MNFDFSDDQKMLRENAQRFLGERASFAAIRRHVESGAAFDTAAWNQMAEMGWLGAAIPESLGGLGLGPLELCVLNEEVGRSLVPVPFFSTVCVAAELLKKCSSPAALETLEAIASKGLRAVLATAEGRRDWTWTALATQWDGAFLSGCKAPVADLPAAQVVIVSAVQADEPVLVLIDLCSSGVESISLPGLDSLRPHGSLSLTKVAGVELARGDAARTALEHALTQASIFAAFEQIGGAEGAMKMACTYAMQRHAFGRPIAGNQAVKHKLADMLVKIELARSNAYFGAWAMEQDGRDLARAAAIARLSATEAFEFAAEENLHLHGGIGYTWEADCHFYYRRARLLSVSLRDLAFWAERLLALPQPVSH